MGRGNHPNEESSLSSQPSLPSVPSLTPPPSAAAAASKYSSSSTTTTHRCLATIKGGDSYVFCLSLAGKHLYIGSSNGDIAAAVSGGPAALRLVGRSGSAVKCIVTVGDKLISAHQDHRIRIWKMDKELAHKKCYKCIATLPTWNDRLAKFFCPKDYMEVRRHKRCTWVHHVDTVSALALSTEASFLYSVSWDRTLKVWRTADFKCLQSVRNAHDDAINAIAVSGDGIVYTGSADKTIKAWKAQCRRGGRVDLVATLEKHMSAVNALALTFDGSTLYSGACDRSIIVWEKDDDGRMVVVGALRGHTKAILCIAVVSELVFSGSADKSVRVWKRGIGRSYSCLVVWDGHLGPVKCLTADIDKNNPSSYVVYSGSLDYDIKVWEICVTN